MCDEYAAQAACQHAACLHSFDHPVSTILLRCSWAAACPAEVCAVQAASETAVIMSAVPAEQGVPRAMQRKGQAISALEADPWETHAALTAAERDLLGNLRTQRGVVMQANEQVERLERSRMACWSRLVSALLQTYAPHSGIPTGGAFKPLEQLQRAHPPLRCPHSFGRRRAWAAQRATAAGQQARWCWCASSSGHAAQLQPAAIRLSRLTPEAACGQRGRAGLRGRG